MDVRVHQGSAAHARGGDGANSGERAHVVKATLLPMPRLIPEQILDALDVAREVSRTIAPSALQHDDAPPGRGETRGRDRATESGTDNHRVKDTHVDPLSPTGLHRR